MNPVHAFRQVIAKLDTENFDGAVPTYNQSTAMKAVQGNLLDAVIHGTNAAVAGTPASWFTAPATVLYGGAKILGGIVASLGGGWVGPGTQAGNRMMLSGVKNIVGGATAPIPVIGTYVNATLAGIDAAQLVNTVIPAKRLD